MSKLLTNTTNLQEVLEVLGNKSSGSILQNKTVTPSAELQLVIADFGCDGLNRVIVNGDNDLTPKNIKSGVTIFGVDGKLSEEPILQDKTIEPSLSKQTVVADIDYDGLGEVTVCAIPTTSQAIPSISVDKNGLITATVDQNSGYVSEGTTLTTHQLAFQPAKTITPGTTSQIAVSSGYYTGGDIVVNGDINLIPDNIKSGVNVFGVEGTFYNADYEAEDRLVDGTMTMYTNDRLTTLAMSAFCSRPNLTSVKFPACISIGSGAFLNCKSLTSISFPACTNIGNSAFFCCSSLTTVNFPVCTNIGSSAFQHCKSLISVSFPACEYIASDAFWYCKDLTSVDFPVCTNIENGAFYSCTKLTTANFPACTNIGGYAFYDCLSLTSVDFPVCINIGSSAFYDCRSLTSADFPACTNIGNYAFYNCQSLTSVYFPVCTSVGNYAFHNCQSLTSVYFPVCTSIGNGAFEMCASLTSVSLPVCTSIGMYAFYGCMSLTSVDFPVCTNIGNYAFERCASLTSVSLPVCTSIGSAFYCCYNLSSITLGASSVCTLSNSAVFASTPYAGYSASFSGTPYIYVPASLVDAYKSATNWTYFSSYITAIVEET